MRRRQVGASPSPAFGQPRTSLRCLGFASSRFQWRRWNRGAHHSPSRPSLGCSGDAASVDRVAAPIAISSNRRARVNRERSMHGSPVKVAGSSHLGDEPGFRSARPMPLLRPRPWLPATMRVTGPAPAHPASCGTQWAACSWLLVGDSNCRKRSASDGGASRIAEPDPRRGTCPANRSGPLPRSRTDGERPSLSNWCQRSRCRSRRDSPPSQRGGNSFSAIVNW